MTINKVIPELKVTAVKKDKQERITDICGSWGEQGYMQCVPIVKVISDIKLELINYYVGIAENTDFNQHDNGPQNEITGTVKVGSPCKIYIHVVDGKYLRTTQNDKKTDNLDKLPPCNSC